MAVVDPFSPSTDETTSTSPKENKEETFTFNKTKSEEPPTEKADSMANLTGVGTLIGPISTVSWFLGFFVKFCLVKRLKIAGS